MKTQPKLTQYFPGDTTAPRTPPSREKKTLPSGHTHYEPDALLSTIFHETWDTEHTSWEAAVAAYRDRESFSVVKAARRGLTGWLRDGNEQQMRSRVGALGGNAVPSVPNVQAWLRAVEEILAAKPTPQYEPK